MKILHMGSTGVMDSLDYMVSTGCTARARRAANNMRSAMEYASFPEDSDPRRILAGIVAMAMGDSAKLSVLERALCEAVQRSISKGEGDTDDQIRKIVISDMDKFVNTRIVSAAQGAIANVQELCYSRQYNHVALYAGSDIAEVATTGMSKSVPNVTVIDTLPRAVGRQTAKRLSNQQMFVRYGLISAADSLLDGVNVLLLGAEEIAMNGCIVVAAGAATICALCKEKEIPVIVIAQTAKFSDSMILDHQVQGNDVLRAHEVTTIITEHGSVDPIMAPRVLRHTAYDTGKAVQI